MAFALSGNTITQSGTDTPATVISGIGAIAGVTSASFSTYTQLTIPYKLNITGTMTTDSTVKFSMTRGGTFANEITIANGATWTAKEVRNLNGYNYYYQLPSLDFNNAALAGSTFSGSGSNAIIVNGGTLDLANIVVNGNGGNWWNGGTIRFRDVTYNAQGLSSVADTQFTTQSGTPTLDIIGWKVIGGKIFIGAANITNFKGVQPLFMQRGFGTFTNGFVLQDFVGGGGNYGDLSAYANPNYEARNLGIGTNTTYYPWILNEGNSRGTIRATSDIDLVVTNNAGSSVSSFISYLKDNATGAPTGFTANNYYINTATSGTLSQRILIGVLVASAGVAASFAKRSATQTNDLYSFYIFDYNHNILSTQAFNLAGTGVKSASAIALVDNNVTLTKANALAKLASSFTVNTSTNTITVTANSTLDDVYDAMKAFKCQAVQANLEYPTISTQAVNASGNTITTAMNIVVNSGISLSVGTKFKNVTTSVAFTLNGSIASGVSVNANVTQNTPTNLTGVVIDGNLTYNTNTPITVTLTDCNISGTVINSGTGIVTIINNNSTIGTIGTNIAQQLYATLSITMPSGTFIYVENNSGVQQLYQESTGAAITLNVTGGAGTWILKLAQFGKISQSIQFTPSVGGILSYSPSLTTDPFVNDTLANVIDYTDLNTTQKIYNYSSFYGTSNQGIIIGSVMSKAFGSLTIPLGLTLNPSASSLFSVTSGVVTTKTSDLNESVTILSNGNFIQNTATLSNNVTIRTANLNSELLFVADSITLFPTSNDRDTNSNAGPTSTIGIIRFLYNSVISGVTMGGAAFLRVDAGIILFSNITLVQGINSLDFGTSGQLTILNAKVDELPQNVWSYGEGSTDPDIARTLNGSIIK